MASLELKLQRKVVKVSRLWAISFSFPIKILFFGNSLLVTLTTQVFDDDNDDDENDDHTSLGLGFDLDLDSGLIEKPLFTLTTIRLLNCLVNNSINQWASDWDQEVWQCWPVSRLRLYVRACKSMRSIQNSGFVSVKTNKQLVAQCSVVVVVVVVVVS